MSGIIQCEIWTSLSQIEWIFLLLLLMPFGDHFLRISYQSHSREEHRKCSLIWLVWKEIAVSIPFHWDWIKTFLLHTTDFSNITTISSLKIFNNFSNLSSLLMPVREYSPGKEKSVLPNFLASSYLLWINSGHKISDQIDPGNVLSSCELLLLT